VISGGVRGNALDVTVVTDRPAALAVLSQLS